MSADSAALTATTQHKRLISPQRYSSDPLRGHRGPQPPIFKPQGRVSRPEDRDQVSLPCGRNGRKRAAFSVEPGGGGAAGERSSPVRTP